MIDGFERFGQIRIFTLRESASDCMWNICTYSGQKRRLVLRLKLAYLVANQCLFTGSGRTCRQGLIIEVACKSGPRAARPQRLKFAWDAILIASGWGIWRQARFSPGSLAGEEFCLSHKRPVFPPSGLGVSGHGKHQIAALCADFRRTGSYLVIALPDRRVSRSERLCRGRP